MTMLFHTCAAFGDDRLGNRAVGVDGVAAVDEEQRVALAHRLVDLHAAEAGIDAPALAGGVAAPDEPQVACTRPNGTPFVDAAARAERRSGRSPARSIARSFFEALERDPHEDVAARLEAARGPVAP